MEAAEEQVPNYMANKMRKATMRQKRPMASDRAKPRMAYEKSCCFKEGFLWKEAEKQGPVIRELYKLHKHTNK